LTTTLLNLLEKLNELKFALPLSDTTLTHPTRWNTLFSPPPPSTLNLSFSLSSSFNKSFTHTPQNSSPLSVSLSPPPQTSHSTILPLSSSSTTTLLASTPSYLQQDKSINVNFATSLHEEANFLKNEDQQSIMTTIRKITEQETQKTGSNLNEQQHSQESVETGIVTREIQVVV
jgi:hypothetical protein